MKVLTPFLISLLAIMLSRCSALADETYMVKTEIYFGRSNKSGIISDSAWSCFQNKINENFHGYTELQAIGYWTDLGGNPIREKTAMLIYIHESTAAEDAKIDSLIQNYKKVFNQESVLKTDHKVKTNFY